MKRLHRQKPFWTEPLFEKLEKELSLLEPFTLQTNGFATFLPTDFTTIYAAIRSTPEMEDWFKRLRKSFERKKGSTRTSPSRGRYLTIKPKNYGQSLKTGCGTRNLELKRLTIWVQRETFGHEKIWRPFKDIPFRGKPEWNVLPEKKKEVVKMVDENQISLF